MASWLSLVELSAILVIAMGLLRARLELLAIRFADWSSLLIHLL